MLGLAGLALALSLAGCAEEDMSSGASPPLKPDEPFSLDELLADVQAGKPLSAAATEADTLNVAKGTTFIGRTDPFGLLRQESAYERSQRAERLMQESGGFLTVWEPGPGPSAIPPTIQMEPQPYRRLSGILIGDSVLAIMELENGTTIIVRPGTKIPNTDWTVVSLDADKAVLRRPGNLRPTQIVVRLETPMNRGSGGGGTTGGGAGGRVGGGPDDNPGGGRRGGGPGNIGGGM